MKLYYIPGACSRAANILLRESGVEPELVLVDPATKKTSEGGDYLDINPSAMFRPWSWMTVRP